MAAPAALGLTLAARIAACPAPDLQQARTWLVCAGQIEQAVRDGGGGAAVQALTDRAAELFLAHARKPSAAAQRHAALRHALAALRLPEAPAEVRIPEGFAWYALYPEAYAAAADRWAAACWRGEPVAVIGLRSIGTALGAVVAAALARRLAVRGAAVRRMTLRPEGHPFARRALLPGAVQEGATAIIVDEGPGLSGSSMAGMAEALAAHGVDAARIVFFPGHGRGPGAMAEAGTRRWWTAARCWTGPAPERPEQRQPGLRWLFGGFAAVNGRLDTLAEVKQARQAALSAQGLACPCPAAADGWLGIAEEGTALSGRDLSAGLLRNTIAPYIARAARPCPAPALQRAAAARIVAALPLPGVAHAAERVLTEGAALPLAGDGRMAPGEWLRQPSGRVLKRNATGTDCEHSWPGEQSVLWDVAGAMAAWDMEPAARAALLGHLAEDHGLKAPPQALALHEAGYCALQRAQAAHDGAAAAAAQWDRLLEAAVARLAAPA